MSDAALPTYADVLAAATRIAPHVHRTPILTSRLLDAEAGAQLRFKAEPLQRTGVFKARGATNAVFALPDEHAARGVVTHSSGNHALALSYAAARRGIPCHVVMPENALRAKRAAVLAYGGRITDCAPTTAAREATAAEVERATGATLIHPFDNPAVIAGQGTCARELLEDAGPLDAIVAPIGGGGLISGTVLSAGALSPGTEVFAAEPEGADDAARSFRAGRLIPCDSPRTIADGLRVSIRPRTWHFVRTGVADVLTVSEAEIVAAMRLLFVRLKLVTEPSSAVALAAVLRHPGRFAGRRVGILLSGGNADLDHLPWQSGEA